MEWLIAFSISIPIMLIFLSIPALFAIYKLGFREYIRKWKSISLLRRGLSLSYKIEKTQTLNYNYYNGKTKSVTSKVVDYYYPIFKDSDVIIVQNNESHFSSIYVVFNRRVCGDWVEDTTELRTSECPYQQLFIGMIKKKLIKLRDNSVKLESVNKLEEIIYSDLIERNRDNKINSILNE